jgi:hypothetical protein
MESSNQNGTALNIVSMNATGDGFLQTAIQGDIKMKNQQMDRTTIQLTDEEAERISALETLFDDDTIENIRESEERRLAINEAESIFRNAADRNLRKGTGR